MKKLDRNIEIAEKLVSLLLSVFNEIRKSSHGSQWLETSYFLAVVPEVYTYMICLGMRPRVDCLGHLFFLPRKICNFSRNFVRVVSTEVVVRIRLSEMDSIF